MGTGAGRSRIGRLRGVADLNRSDALRLLRSPDRRAASTSPPSAARLRCASRPRSSNTPRSVNSSRAGQQVTTVVEARTHSAEPPRERAGTDGDTSHLIALKLDLPDVDSGPSDEAVRGGNPGGRPSRPRSTARLRRRRRPSRPGSHRQPFDVQMSGHDVADGVHLAGLGVHNGDPAFSSRSAVRDPRTIAQPPR
jgi:hypothetical protein